MAYEGPTSGVLNFVPLTTGASNTAPTIDTGSDGEYCLDLNTGFLYGPKDGGNSSYPWPIASRLWQGMTYQGNWGYPAQYTPGDVVVDGIDQYLCIKAIAILPFTPTSNPGPYYAGDFISDGGLYLCYQDTPNKPSVSLTGWLSYSPSADYGYSAFGWNVTGNFLKLSNTIQAEPPTSTGMLTSFEVVDESIATNHLVDDSVTAVKLSGVAGSEAVSTGRIRDGAVTTAKIADTNVSDAKLTTTGVTAGTYPKVTVTNKGRVTAGASLASSDLPVPMNLQPATNSTTALTVTNAAGIITVFGVDTTNTLTRARQGFEVLSVIDTAETFRVRKSDNTNVLAVDTSPAKATVTGESVLNGAFTSAYRGITGARTLDSTDHVVNCTANTFTVTLPTAVGVAGRVYRIKNSGTGVITVATTSSQTIDGSTTRALASQYSFICVVSNGANWTIVESSDSDSIAHARSSECGTMPRYFANISNTMVSGTIYAGRAVYTGNQASNQFSNVRFMLPSITSTTFTQLRAAVYDSTGALVTNGYTADLSASATASALMTGALNATVTLTAGSIYYLGIVAVFTGTAPTFRGMVTSAAIAGLSPQMSRSATGYSTGVPGSVSSATALLPWVELY